MLSRSLTCSTSGASLPAASSTSKERKRFGMASANAGSAGPSSGTRSSTRGTSASATGSKRPGQPNLEYTAPSSLQQPAVTVTTAAVAAAAAAGVAAANLALSGETPATPVPLKLVVREAVKRWFEDTAQDALRGDTKQQALLGQMLAEGYGCKQDLRAAKEWTDTALARGYRMKGVYCEI